MLTKAMLILTLFVSAATAHAHDGQPPKDTNCEAEYDRQGVVEALKVGDYNRLLEGAAKRAALSAWKGSGFVATVMRYVKSTDILVAVSTTDGGAAFVVQISWNYSRDGELNYDKFSVYVEADGTAHALPLAPGDEARMRAEAQQRLEREAASNDNSITEPSLNIPSPLDPRAGLTEPPVLAPVEERRAPALSDAQQLLVSIARGGINEEYNGHLPGIWAGGSPRIDRIDVRTVNYSGGHSGTVILDVYASNVTMGQSLYQVVVTIRDGRVEEISNPAKMFAAQNSVPIIEEAPIEERVAEAVRKYVLARSPNKRIGRTTVSEADRDSANPTFSVSVPVQTEIGLRGELYTVEVLPNGSFSIRAIGAQG